MANKTFEKCIADILKDIEKRKNVAYEDKNSVRRYNAALDRMRFNLFYIDVNYPDRIDGILALLNHPDPEVIHHIAPVVLEMSCCTLEQKWIALEAMRRLLNEHLISSIDCVVLSYVLPQKEKELTDKIRESSANIPSHE